MDSALNVIFAGDIEKVALQNVTLAKYHLHIMSHLIQKLRDNLFFFSSPTEFLGIGIVLQLYKLHRHLRSNTKIYIVVNINCWPYFTMDIFQMQHFASSCHFANVALCSASTETLIP